MPGEWSSTSFSLPGTGVAGGWERSGGAAEGGGRTDHAGPEPRRDAVADRLRGQPVLACLVEADLLGDLVGVNRVHGLQDTMGRAGWRDGRRVPGTPRGRVVHDDAGPATFEHSGAGGTPSASRRRSPGTPPQREGPRHPGPARGRHGRGGPQPLTGPGPPRSQRASSAPEQGTMSATWGVVVWDL